MATKSKKAKTAAKPKVAPKAAPKAVAPKAATEPSLVFVFDGVQRTLNPDMVKRQNVSPENIESLKLLAVDRMTVEAQMAALKATDVAKLRELEAQWTDLQFSSSYILLEL